MRDIIRQTIRFNDCFNNNKQITMRIEICNSERTISIKSTEPVSPFILFEIISANKRIKRIKRHSDERDIIAIHDRMAIDYCFSNKDGGIGTTIVSCPYPSYTIKDIEEVHPDELFAILYNILYEKLKYTPKNEHPKKHKKFLRKKADFRYCKYEIIPAKILANAFINIDAYDDECMDQIMALDDDEEIW